MAKKNKERIILEDIELKPQVIGYTYQKKSNIGRVIFIFIVFILVVFYINDISVFVNDLIGKNTASTIDNLAGNNNDTPTNNNNNNNVENEIIFNTYMNGMEIKENNMTLNNFNFLNNKLTFNIMNNSDASINYSSKKYFIETYTQNKTLLERYKLDVGVIAKGASVSYEYMLRNSFYYIVIEEKTINDYPVVNLEESETGVATITCTKDVETIVYTFKNSELTEINHTITNNNTFASDYYINYNAYQNKVTNYNNVEGITATFNSSLNGFTAVFAIDLIKANLSDIEEKYYYGYKEVPKVVKFEMQTYGFTCN